MSDGKHSRGDGPRSGKVAHRPASTLGSRQFLTVALLFGGYAACYFCRADFSVATPLLIDELGSHGISHADAIVHIGQIASLGVFAYALGKAQRLLAQARDEATRESTHAREALSHEVGRLAVAGASRLLGREIDAKTHAQLLDQLAAEVARG